MDGVHGAAVLGSGAAEGSLVARRGGNTARGALRILDGGGGPAVLGGGAAQVTPGAILLLAQVRHATRAVSEFLRWSNGPVRTGDLRGQTEPVLSGSGQTGMRGRQMTSDPLADSCTKLGDKDREGFHTENIPRVSQQ
jgi:hypothetical protein